MPSRISRIDIDLESARQKVDGLSARSLNSKHGVPRSVTDDLGNKSLTHKSTLLEPVAKLWSAIQVENPRSVNPIEIMTSGAIEDLTEGDYDDVEIIHTNSTTPDDQLTPFVSFGPSLEQIKKTKHAHEIFIMEELILGYHEEITSELDQERARALQAEFEFFSNVNTEILTSPFFWQSKSTGLVNTYADELRSIEKAVTSKEERNNNEHSGFRTLSSLLAVSAESEELKKNVRPDLIYDDFRIFSVPIYGQFDLEIVWRDMSQDTHDVEHYIEKRLTFSRKIPKLFSTLVITPADTQVLLLKAPIKGKRQMFVGSKWGDDPLYDKNGKWLRCREAIDLFEQCSDRVTTVQWSKEA